MHVALTIAASDPSGGAGIQVDLAVFRELGVYGTSVVTNVTAQNTRGFDKICKVPPRIIAAQIDAVARDFRVGACKIGVLYAPRAVAVVAERIRRREIPRVVFDPVMAAKDGRVLMTPNALKRVKRLLLPRTMVITPNFSEASVLSGVDVKDSATAKEAAKVLAEMGPYAVLIKGGHAEGEPVDILYHENQFYEFAGKRSDKHMHGTGCVLSAAITARLAVGDDLLSAVEFAKRYVERAIERSAALGKGQFTLFVGGLG
ncbi:MAG: bifunctional hydroxymethylpyrimidine kinase/phosphomethylpyrimidine kinase [Armatimonadota bacterium]|nr:bifunctional hydroxymethylpyrimidine kinase/phosphomethylpyrimidine kinase [Armatimonadota bacterium]